MPARNVILTDYYDQFVNALVSSGRFTNASEVVRAGLRLLEQQAREDEQKLAVLRVLASEGFDQLDQGQGTPIDSPTELLEYIGQIGRRAGHDVERRAAGG